MTAGPTEPTTERNGGTPTTSLLFDVFALNQAVSRLLAERMRDGPLTPTEYAVYSAIFELEAATPTELAARLGMRLTTCLDQLREIERRGHARRLAHPTDRRSYRVVLSSDGLAAQRAANRQFELAYAAFRSELGDEAGAKDAMARLRDAATRAGARSAGARRASRAAPQQETAATPPSGGRAG